MKNSYMKPICTVEHVQLEYTILNGSILSDGNSIIKLPGGSNGTFDDNTINSKGHNTWSAWDTEWDSDNISSGIWND